MADNTTLDPGAGGDVIATDDITGVHYQRVKLTDGTADSTTAIVAGGGTEAAALRVTVASDSTGVLSVDDNGGSLTIDGNVGITHAKAEDVAAASGDNGVPILAVRNDGAAAKTDTDGDYSMLATDSAGRLGITDLGGAISVDDNGGSLTVDVGTALPTGDNNIGNVDVLSISAGTNTIGDVGVKPRTTGGLSVPATQLLDIDETEDEIKNAAGQVFGWYFYNDGASEAYIKFYNATAANVTVGSTTPLFTIGIPAGAAANVFTDIGIAFSTAITVAATTGIAVADTGAPAANQVSGVVFYS